jgi:hypothetical protein
MFKRGIWIRKLLAEFPPDQLILIDTSLRCAGWPAPRLYSRARRENRPVLAGSDPLPPAGEEALAGCYYCTLSIPAPAIHPGWRPVEIALVRSLCGRVWRQRKSRGSARRRRPSSRDSCARKAGGAVTYRADGGFLSATAVTWRIGMADPGHAPLGSRQAGKTLDASGGDLAECRS